jgi:hypothetical protein
MARYVYRAGLGVIPKEDAEPLPGSAFVMRDIGAFKSPLAGHKWIDGRTQLRDELSRNNCRLVDKSEWKPVYKNPTFALKRGLALNGEKR